MLPGEQKVPSATQSREKKNQNGKRSRHLGEQKQKTAPNNSPRKKKRPNAVAATE